MKPKVIMHTQISLDGCIDGFENTAIYYSLANRFHTDMVLFGSNTVYTATQQCPPEKETDFIKPVIGPNDNRPWGVVPDSRGKLQNLHVARNMGYLKDVIILVSETTPQSYLDYLKERNYDFIVTGEDHVDYKKALEILYNNVKTFRYFLCFDDFFDCNWIRIAVSLSILFIFPSSSIITQYFQLILIEYTIIHHLILL